MLIVSEDSSIDGMKPARVGCTIFLVLMVHENCQVVLSICEPSQDTRERVSTGLSREGSQGRVRGQLRRVGCVRFAINASGAGFHSSSSNGVVCSRSGQAAFWTEKRGTRCPTPGLVWQDAGTRSHREGLTSVRWIGQGLFCHPCKVENGRIGLACKPVAKRMDLLLNSKTNYEVLDASAGRCTKQ